MAPIPNLIIVSLCYNMIVLCAREGSAFRPLMQFEVPITRPVVKS